MMMEKMFFGSRAVSRAFAEVAIGGKVGQKSVARDGQFTFKLSLSSRHSGPEFRASMPKNVEFFMRPKRIS